MGKYNSLFLEALATITKIVIDIFTEDVESSDEDEEQYIVRANDRVHEFPRPDRVYPVQLSRREKVEREGGRWGRGEGGGRRRVREGGGRAVHSEG